MNVRVVVGVLALVVCASAVGIGVVWWQRGEIPFFSQKLLPTSALPTPDVRPLGLNEQQQRVAELAQVGSPEDPLPNLACAFWARNTCQPTIEVVDGATQVGWSDKVSLQETRELRAVVSPYLGWSSAIPHYYKDAMIRGTEPNPYIEYVRQVVLESTSRGINPGLVFALYEQFFMNVEEQKVFPLDPNRLISPSVVAVVADLEEGAQVFARQEVPANEVGRQIATLPYSPESKAVLYVWFRNFYPIHGAATRPVLAQAGWLESRYNNIFRFSVGSFPFPQGTVLNRVWKTFLDSSPSSQQGIVVCDGLTPVRCSVDGQCENILDFDYFCESWLPERSQ